MEHVRTDCRICRYRKEAFTERVDFFLSIFPTYREEMVDADAVVENFRRTINEFKTPLLGKLEENSDDTQNVERINDTLKTLDTLYSVVKRELEAGVKQQKGGGDTLDEKAALSVFEKRGLFEAARSDPAVREKLLHALEVDLKMYPFTRSTEHIKNLEKENVESHQREIVPNLE